MVEPPDNPSLLRRVKTLVIGAPRNLSDRAIGHKLSLIAFFAWVGLGADGLSSSCYGPEASFLALHEHIYLGLFVALATAITVFVISQSYSQIIELFPSGGGGYLVASKLLSPRVGMISGCALLVDYVLTITVSVAQGVEALFSFLPGPFQEHKLVAKVAVIFILTVMNLRGVRESIAPLIPIFLIFLLTHAFAIVYAIGWHGRDFGPLVQRVGSDVQQTYSQIGLWAMLVLVMRSYSMGAGTYTGIEAVSNGLPILREPRVHTGKRTMTYMWISLAFMALGLMIAYLLFGVGPEQDKTLNAVLLTRMASGWGAGGNVFVVVSLISEAALLFVAAQTGFLDGPRVLANMALDRWFPTRLSMLSDRLVTQNGVLLMSAAAAVTLLATGGSVEYMLVLYSINVFITFTLSQLGMVRHWWSGRNTLEKWRRRITVNGMGLFMTAFILVWVVAEKFFDGGWATLVVTGSLVVMVSLIRRHYHRGAAAMRRLDDLAKVTFPAASEDSPVPPLPVPFDPTAKTAVLLVNGFNGLGVHALLNVIKFFGETFKNFVFVQVGVIDAGNFKGADEVEHLQAHVAGEVNRYVRVMRSQGYYAEGYPSVDNDIVDGIVKVAPQIQERFPQCVFFGGQLVFARETFFTRLLHNNVAFAVQRRLYHQGIPFVVLPVRVLPEGNVK
jgi:amino acid transporter